MYFVKSELMELLPFRVRTEDGKTRTNLAQLSTERLAELDIYPATVTKPELEWYQRHGTPVITVEGGTAIVTYPVIDLSSEERAAVLEAAKERKRSEIAAARWAEMSTPTAVDGYEAIWYADKESMNDMLRASSDLQTAIALGHLPENSTVQWKTAEGTFVTLGLNDLVTIRLLLSQRQQGLYAREADWVRQIKDAETPEDLEVIVW